MLPAVFCFKYLDFSVFSETLAENKERGGKSEDKRNEKKDIKTDIDDLRYDFSAEEIELFVEQYDRLKEIRGKKSENRKKIETIESDIKEMELKLNSMKELHSRLSKKFSDTANVEDESVRRLVKTYENMKPTEVAPLILKHEMKVILKIIDIIKPAVAGIIYSEMLKLDRNRVVLVSEKYTGFDTDYTRELMKKEIDEKDLGGGEDSEAKEK